MAGTAIPGPGSILDDQACCARRSCGVQQRYDGSQSSAPPLAVVAGVRIPEVVGALAASRRAGVGRRRGSAEAEVEEPQLGSGGWKLANGVMASSSTCSSSLGWTFPSITARIPTGKLGAVETPMDELPSGPRGNEHEDVPGDVPEV